ncbi:MAG: alpha/beta hydrolase [Candidatus Omnitrophica bacterium]|nr:alpha/beta hydrolase [Candidatus Omnitrophota bacterium]
MQLKLEPFSPDEKILYKKVQNVELKLHVFYPENHKITDQRAAIVFFFGGGWKNGSPEQFYPHCQYFSSRGMTAFAAEYRIESKHGTTPYKCVEDGKSAIRYIRKHARELGIDPTRIAAGGGSAGGHVAAAAGTLQQFDDPADDASISSKPNAMVLFNPVYDNGPDGYGYDRVIDYWQDFSPLHNIDESIPPTVVFLGTQDKLIPVSTARKFQKLVEDVHVRSDLHLYDGQPHGFFNYRDGNNTYYIQTVIAADKFLVSLGYLTGEPTLKIQ